MLLQNELMRVLPPMNQTSLATNQLVKGCEKLLQKVESSSTFFFSKSVHVARFTGPRQTCFATSHLTPVNNRLTTG